MPTTSSPLVSAASAPTERAWNAPNAITLSRIVATPVLLLNLWWQGPVWSTLVASGFLVLSLTDLLDGYLARRAGTVTRLGKLLDPIADKVLILTGLIVLTAIPRIPTWGVVLVVAIVGREVAVTGLRAMASSEGVVVPAAPLGKWKTGLQVAAVTGLLAHYSVLGIPFHALGMLLLVVATGLTLWSGYAYFAAYWSRREDMGSP